MAKGSPSFGLVEDREENERKDRRFHCDDVISLNNNDSEVEWK